MVHFTSRFPEGEPRLHIWIEGVPEPALGNLSRHICLMHNTSDLGELTTISIPQRKTSHPNKFGQPYDQDPKRTLLISIS